MRMKKQIIEQIELKYKLTNLHGFNHSHSLSMEQCLLLLKKNYQSTLANYMMNQLSNLVQAHKLKIFISKQEIQAIFFLEFLLSEFLNLFNKRDYSNLKKIQLANKQQYQTPKGNISQSFSIKSPNTNSSFQNQPEDEKFSSKPDFLTPKGLILNDLSFQNSSTKFLDIPTTDKILFNRSHSPKSQASPKNVMLIYDLQRENKLLKLENEKILKENRSTKEKFDKLQDKYS